MTAQLQRENFQISRDAEYFKADELVKQTGQPVHRFFAVLVKELVDNALDAAEHSGNHPDITISTEHHDDDTATLTVADNGDGIPPEVVSAITDFRTRTSSNIMYRAPTRGAQGNALKTVLGIPHALGANPGRVTIAARGVMHSIEAYIDCASQLRITHDTEPDPGATQGTTISVTIPTDWRGLEVEPDRWAIAFAVLNPRARLTVKIRNSERSGARFYHAQLSEPESAIFYDRTDSGWKRFLPSDPTSPHWYSSGEFAELVTAYATQTAATLRQFVATFKGLASTVKIKAVCDQLPVSRLAELDGRLDLIKDLHKAMLAESAQINPKALGVIGKDHLLMHVSAKDEPQYKCIVGTTDAGLPYVVEALLVKADDPGIYAGVNFSPSFGDPLANTRLEGDMFSTYGLNSFLRQAHASEGYAAVFHLACPSVATTDRGKTAIVNMPEQIRDACSDALWAVCKKAYKHGEQVKRDEVKARRQEEQRHKESKSKELSIAAMASGIISKAVKIASGSDGNPFSVRQLFYAIRPLLRQMTNRELDYNYFSQKIVTDYQSENGAISGLYYDPRGVMYEPHGGERLQLGTMQVDHYHFPSHTFDKILVIEKKGFWPVIQHAKIAERYDMAIVLLEGYASTAARDLLARAADGNYTVYVLHDADPDGYNIARTLREETRRMPDHRIEVIDLGLTVADAKAMGLESESYTRKKALPETLELTPEERDFFIVERMSRGNYEARRYELNAMTSAQFISYVTGKLDAHGAGKLVPDDDVILEQAQDDYASSISDAMRDEVSKILNIDEIIDAAISKIDDLELGDIADELQEAMGDDENRARTWREVLAGMITARIDNLDLESAAKDAVNEALG